MDSKQDSRKTVLRLLLVEDSEDDALLVERQLRRGGYRPHIQRVDTADAMSEALSENRWDIVITDHNLPNFDAHQALALVRKNNPDLPVIIVSGSIGEEIAVEAMKAGANDYIMKDKLPRLVPAVERELRDAELRSAHRKAEATIHYMAYHDPLTGLVNRAEFERRLKQAMSSTQGQQNTHAMLYLDLDQFKIINDTCGHIAGDALLRALTVDLAEHVRGRDTLARLGGDEFGILLENCPLERAQEIAETIRETIHGFRFSWKQHNFVVGASIGVVEIDETSTSVDEVLSSADMACYAAKDLGRNRIHIYRNDDTELNRRHSEMQWATRITQSLEDNRLRLFQHSIVPLNGNPKTKYNEFLVRMLDDSDNIIPPNAFIPAAERYNLMPSVDRWVIENVFHCLSNALHSGMLNEHEPMGFINLSGTSLSDNGLHKFIRKLLHHYSLPPEMICFEITETAAITDFRNAIEFITGIKKEGCRFALDDFGTGMSSFSYLKRIPLDFIKIDGGFVKNLVDDPMDCAIVEAVTRIAHLGDMKTIAEFVQDEACMTLLRQIGVDFAQGYSIDLPTPVIYGEAPANRTVKPISVTAR